MLLRLATDISWLRLNRHQEYRLLVRATSFLFTSHPRKLGLGHSESVPFYIADFLTSDWFPEKSGKSSYSVDHWFIFHPRIPTSCTGSHIVRIPELRNSVGTTSVARDSSIGYLTFLADFPHAAFKHQAFPCAPQAPSPIPPRLSDLSP